MSTGSTLAVQEAEDQFRNHCVRLIARHAAQLVAAKDMGRQDAIKAASEWLRLEIEASGDVTGVSSIENTYPEPSTGAPDNQIAAIERELFESAQVAARIFLGS